MNTVQLMGNPKTIFGDVFYKWSQTYAALGRYRLRVKEPQGGLIAHLGSIPRLPPVDLDIDGKGALDSFAARLVFTAGPDIGVDGHVMLARRGGERR
jgi:autotransporter translocation and assembly factor TamB